MVRVYAIGKCHKNWDGVRNVNVIVVRKEEVEGHGVKGEWSFTPCSSVADECVERAA